MTAFARTVLLIGALAWASAAEAASLEAFVGRWQARDAGLMLVEQSMSGDGFALRVVTAEPQQALSASFAPTDRDGVFASDNDGDPRAGETLIWAREEAEALIVYRMDIASGGAVVLDRLERRLVDGAMTFALSRRRGAEVSETNGTLERLP